VVILSKLSGLSSHLQKTEAEDHAATLTFVNKICMYSAVTCVGKRGKRVELGVELWNWLSYKILINSKHLL
jgi:hypothetical protein